MKMAFRLQRLFIGDTCRSIKDSRSPVCNAARSNKWLRPPVPGFTHARGTFHFGDLFGALENQIGPARWKCATAGSGERVDARSYEMEEVPHGELEKGA